MTTNVSEFEKFTVPLATFLASSLFPSTEVIEFDDFMKLLLEIQDKNQKISYSSFWRPYLVLRWLAFLKISRENKKKQSNPKKANPIPQDVENPDDDRFFLNNDSKIEIYCVNLGGDSKIWLNLSPTSSNCFEPNDSSKSIWLLPFEKNETLDFSEFVFRFFSSNFKTTDSLFQNFFQHAKTCFNQKPKISGTC